MKLCTLVSHSSMNVDRLEWELVIPVLHVRGERGVIVWNQLSYV